MKKLEEIRKEFVNIINNKKISSTERDILLADLMTNIECDFDILKYSKTFNPSAFDLYLEISNLRCL